MKILKVLIMAFGLITLAGCAGTLNLNHAITDTNCQTRQECIKDLGLDKYAEKPDVVFVVEELEIKGNITALLNIGISGKGYLIAIDLCIAKALQKEFPYSKVIIGNNNTHTPGGVEIVNLKNFKITNGVVYDAITTFSGEVKTSDGSVTIEAKGGHGVLTFTTSGSAGRATLKACQDFAKQARKFLESQGIKLSINAGG